MEQFQDSKILIVDDEPQMLELLSAYLDKANFLVDQATNGIEALDKMKETRYDLVVLDVMMPEKDGLSVCLEIRKKSDVPIIMLSARGDELDRIHGLELGADDYLVKPFSPREIVAKIKALLRRAHTAFNIENPNVKRFGALQLDEKARRVNLAGEELNLTPKEYDLLIFFLENSGEVWTRQQILESVWGYNFYGSLRTVDTHVKTLRMKLNIYANYISTVWGVGYKFEVGK